MRTVREQKNMEIRQAIANKGLKYYEVAEELHIGTYTFTHWLQRELPKEKKQLVLDAVARL